MGYTQAQRLYEMALTQEDSDFSHRSDAYKRGFRAALEFYCNGEPIKTPYKPGTAADDAFLWGYDEGKAAWRRNEEKIRGLDDYNIESTGFSNHGLRKVLNE